MEKGRIEFDDPTFRPTRSRSVIRREAIQVPHQIAQEVIDLRAALGIALDIIHKQHARKTPSDICSNTFCKMVRYLLAARPTGGGG